MNECLSWPFMPEAFDKAWGVVKAGSSMHDDCEGCDDCLCGYCGEQVGVNAKCECRD